MLLLSGQWRSRLSSRSWSWYVDPHCAHVFSFSGKKADLGSHLKMEKSFTYGIGIALYNVYLHPLAAFPGPLLARSSLVCGVHTPI